MSNRKQPAWRRDSGVRRRICRRICRRVCRRVGHCIMAVALTAPALAPAQTAPPPGAAPNPFAPPGAAPNPFAPPGGPAAPGGDVFGTPTAPSGMAPPSGAAPAEEDPVVLQILATQPQTGEQLMQALQHFVNLRRADRAKEMIAKLEALGLDAAALADLAERYGADIFLTLSLEPPYAPEGRAFAQKVQSAAYQKAHDPARIAKLIEQLSHEEASLRSAAVADLRLAGLDAIAPLIAALSDAGRSDEHERLEQGLARLGEFVAPVMVGVLDSPDAGLQIRGLNVLGRLRARRQLPEILGALHDPTTPSEVRAAAARAARAITGRTPALVETTSYLRLRAEEYSQGATLQEDLEGQVTLWTWSPNGPAPRRLPRREAGWVLEARLARRLHQIAPDNVDWRRERLISGLTAAKVESGFDAPIADQALRDLCRQLGPEVLEDVFVAALKKERLLAAAGAAELLGEFGDASFVMAGGGRPRALVKAVTHSDRRVQFAALGAIMKLDPKHAYRGASWTTQSLGFFASSLGKPRALIGHPERSSGMSWAGLLSDLGWESDVVNNGRDLAVEAPRRADYDLILVSDRLNNWRLDETLQRLREHPAVTGLPIAVISEPDRVQSIASLGLQNPRMLTFAQPYTAPHMQRIVNELLALRPFPPPAQEIRLQRASAALTWMERLTKNRYEYVFYDFNNVRASLDDALRSPETAPDACHVLGRLGTADAQRALLGVAGAHLLPLTVRQAAVDSFQEAVQRKGLLLTPDETRRQYNLYNQTERLDRSAQQIMGAVLDIIEARK